MSILAGWSNFYVITGSSAAALTGLMFVVVTLVAGNREREHPEQATAINEGTDAFSTPTVVHFCAAFLVSGVMSAPWPRTGQAALAIACCGVLGVLYVFRVALKTSRVSNYRPGIDDWLWFAIIPLVAYAAIALAGVLVFSVPVAAGFILGGATLLLIFIGIHNAWDIVTYIATSRP